MKNRERLLTAFYLAAIVWLNAYLCREVFFLDHIGQMNSMHGFWMGLARLAGDAWYKPSWWRYAYDGMPFDYTYAPLVPGLIAGISKLAGWSLGRAFGVVAGFVFCLGPLAMFLMAREVTRRAGWSFIAALVYSVTAPSQWFAPDTEFGLGHIRDARRILLTFSWDDVPHELALALVCLSVVFLVRGLRGWKTGSFVWAGLWLALALLASAFGTTATVLVLACLGLSWETGDWKRNAGVLTLCGLLAYLAMSPFLPPSLFAAIHRNANFRDGSAWAWVAFLTLGGLACGGLLLSWLLRGRAPWHIRFFALLAFMYLAISVPKRWNLQFLPQPERYKIEMEVWLVLAAAFAIAQLIDRAPRAARAALALLLLWPMAAQVKAHRRYAKEIIRSSDVRETIEYQVAAWLAANLPEGRIFAPGTIGQWMNAFTAQQQFGGGSYPTIPTLPIQFAIDGIPWVGTSDSVELATLWLQAYGVDAMVVPGPGSPEYWKPFRFPAQFVGALPLLWRQRDTSIYAVPRIRSGLAHVIPESSIVQKTPESLSDTGQIRAYAAQLQNLANPPAEWRWIDNNHGRIRTRMAPGDVISLQITYRAGWKATTDGRPVAIVPDGLAQMAIHAGCSGPCEVDLSYDGGWEDKGLRIVSLATILGTAWVCVASLRRRKIAPFSTS